LVYFINGIKRHGEGHEEYIRLVDMFMNNDDATLNLVSGDSKDNITYLTCSQKHVGANVFITGKSSRR
jgi:FlaG/FlaF family flagellin (archaellin)